MIFHVRRRRDPIIVGFTFRPLRLGVAWWARGRQDWCIVNLVGHYFS